MELDAVRGRDGRAFASSARDHGERVAGRTYLSKLHKTPASRWRSSRWVGDGLLVRGDAIGEGGRSNGNFARTGPLGGEAEAMERANKVVAPQNSHASTVSGQRSAYLIEGR